MSVEKMRQSPTFSASTLTMRNPSAVLAEYPLSGDEASTSPYSNSESSHRNDTPNTDTYSLHSATLSKCPNLKSLPPSPPESPISPALDAKEKAPLSKHDSCQDLPAAAAELQSSLQSSVENGNEPLSANTISQLPSPLPRYRARNESSLGLTTQECMRLGSRVGDEVAPNYYAAWRAWGFDSFVLSALLLLLAGGLGWADLSLLLVLVSRAMGREGAWKTPAVFGICVNAPLDGLVTAALVGWTLFGAFVGLVWRVLGGKRRDAVTCRVRDWLYAFTRWFTGSAGGY